MESKDDSEELAEWQQVHFPLSTISATEDIPSVFPPSNHEDLQISDVVDQHQQLQEQEQEQEQEPIRTPPPHGGDGIRRWMRVHVGALQTQILMIFGRLRNYVTCKVGVWSLRWIVGGVVAAFLFSFWRQRVLLWWQLDSSRKSLIDDNDKKMKQLLLQVAQMKEMLLTRRMVPVIRI